MTIKSIIIDDEAGARKALRKLLGISFHTVSILGEASSVREGIQMIQDVQVDIIFLDIQMKDGTGFDVLENCPNITQKVVFTTAYSNHILNAMRERVADYLVKPYSLDDLNNAIKRVLKIGQSANYYKSVAPNQDLSLKRIEINFTDGVEYVDPHNIIMCKADGAYTELSLNNDERLMCSRILKQFELLLSDFNFFRISHSELVNLFHVKRVLKRNGECSAVLSNGDTYKVSRRKKADFLLAVAAFNMS